MNYSLRSDKNCLLWRTQLCRKIFALRFSCRLETSLPVSVKHDDKAKNKSSQICVYVNNLPYHDLIFAVSCNGWKNRNKCYEFWQQNSMLEIELLFIKKLFRIAENLLQTNKVTLNVTNKICMFPTSFIIDPPGTLFWNAISS